MRGVEAIGTFLEGMAKHVRAEDMEQALDIGARYMKTANGIVDRDPDFAFGALEAGLDAAKILPAVTEVGVHGAGVLRVANHLGNNSVSRWLTSKSLQATADVAGVANSVLPNKWFRRAKDVAELGQLTLEHPALSRNSIDTALKFVGNNPDDIRAASKLLERTAGVAKRAHERAIENPAVAHAAADYLDETAKLSRKYADRVQRLADSRAAGGV